MNKRSKWLRDLSRSRSLYLMILPALLFFFVFSYLPMAGLYFAFTSFNFNDGLFGSPFVGWDNFRFLYLSGDLFTITKNTILYNLVFILGGNLLQMGTAIVLNELQSKWFKKVSQSMMFLPYFISYVLVGTFIYSIFNYDYGLFNQLREWLDAGAVNVYSEPSYWKYIITSTYMWKWVGYGTVIYLASILAIDPQLYEAANIDGATRLQQIRCITAPLLTGTFIILVLFSLGNLMKGQFDLFYNLVGQNGVLYEATDIIDTYVYRSLMVNFDMGMGAAAGLYQSAFGLVVILSVNYLIRKHKAEYALF